MIKGSAELAAIAVLAAAIGGFLGGRADKNRPGSVVGAILLLIVSLFMLFAAVFAK